MSQKERMHELLYSNDDRVELCERICNLEAEHAKLRELVDYMTPIALYEASEQERDRMRELGAEVDG